MLEEYVGKYDKYLAYAFSICGCNDLKNDLVNDMFLKLDRILKEDPSKEVTDGYIYMILKSTYLNQVRDNKEFVLDGYVFEAIDDKEVLEKRVEVLEALKKINYTTREIVLKSMEMPMRDIADLIGVSKGCIQGHKEKGIKQLKNILDA